MVRRRRHFGLLSARGRLIAVGGDAENSGSYRSLEWFDPDCCCWKLMVGSLEHPAYRAGIVALP